MILALACSATVFAQAHNGELRLKVTDPSGLAVKAPIQIVSEANQYRRTFTTDDQGALTVQRLPFGMYQLQINLPGFAELSQSIDIHRTFGPIDDCRPSRVGNSKRCQHADRPRPGGVGRPAWG